ncbi:MAG TPA: helix-turn-helix domain-containing protein [Acidimicrobiia bacterium]|nr:helix-turn-helix domain-containing protein [Acidimicrobiia bacterium]
MAIATRRLQGSVTSPAVPGDRSGGGLRRARLDSVAPPGPDSREAQRRVMEAAVEAGDLATTIGAIAALTRSEAVLQDPFLAVLASAPAPGATQSGGDGVALTRSGCPLVRDLLRAGAHSGPRPADGAPGPSLVELPKYGSTPARLVAPITARGELLGFLVVAAVDRGAYATVEAAAPVLALLLQAEERLCRLLDRDQRELFLDLLAGRSADCLVIHGRRLGHDLEQPHWPLVFTATAGAEGDGGTARLEQVVHDALRDGRQPGRPAPVVGVDGDAVVVFLPDHHPDGPAGVARRVRSLATRRGLPVVAGWGPRCDDLGSYRTGVARARWVVDVLAGMPGEPAATGYDDLGIYALLYEKRDQDQLADFAERWLGPLLEHSELAHTLRVLLETGGPSAAATALFVHISTLKYRLRKIESILDVDLSDPEVCFNLRLAFKILAVHERLSGSRQ